MLGEEKDGVDSDILYNDNIYFFGKPKKKKIKKSNKEKIKENSWEIDDIEIRQNNTIDEERRYKKNSISCPNCKLLRQKIKEFEQLEKELLKEKDKLSKKNDELFNNNTELLKKTDSLNNQISELTNKINKLKNINETLDNQIFKLNSEKNDLIVQLNNLKTKLNSINNNTYSSSDSNGFRLFKNISYNNNTEENKSIENKNEIEELKKRLLNLEFWKKTIDEKNKSYSEKIKSIEDNLKILNEKKQESNSEEESEEEFENHDSPKLQNKQINNTNNNDNNNYNITLSKSLNLFQAREIQRKKQKNLSYDNNATKNNQEDIYPKRKTSIDFSNNYKKKENLKKFNSKILTEIDELNLIAKGLVKNNMENLKKLKIGYKLIYRASEDGDDAENFHQKCDNISGTLTVIKTKDDWIFGGYTLATWNTKSEEGKKDLNSFVFSINLEKLYYVSEQKKNCIYCDINKGPSFIGMFSVEESMLNMANKVSPWGVQCYDGESLPYEINGGKKEFYIEELEVFKVILKRITE